MSRNEILSMKCLKAIASPFCLCALATAAFICSCSNISLAPKSSLSAETSSYCRLLHVAPGVSESPKPRPFLGISFVPERPDAEISGCRDGHAVRILAVIEGAPARDVGLREGDIILSVDKSPLCMQEKVVPEYFSKIISRHEIGSMVALDVLRGSEKMSFVVRVAAMPSCRKAEAEHPEMEECPDDKQSMLESALRRKKALPLFYGVVSGLHERSDFIHDLSDIKEGQCGQLQLKEFTYLYRNPLSAGVVARDLSGRFISETGRKNISLDKALRVSAGLLDVDTGEFQEEGNFTFPVLISTLLQTKTDVEEAFSRLSPEEKELLREKAIDPWDDADWNTIVGLSSKVELKKLFDALLPVVSFLSGEHISLLKQDLLERFKGISDPVLFQEMTPAGKVIVGGTGPNVYREDAALILDLGGDDLYLNNAGGTRPGIPLAIVVDWAGNDRYITKENFSQGAGLLGGGFLIDLAGADIFDALDGSQGTGFFGAGILYHGSGQGIYHGRKSCQGTGQVGAGLLWNSAGDTSYSCAEHGQALGFFKGAGILIDEEGDDYYQLGGLEPDFRDPENATVSMGQGFGKGLRQEKKWRGVSGGVGLLIDKSGDDTYMADYFAQGASYYYGLGILDDLSGDDRYIAGRYAQGAGIHSSVGVFIDRRGNDFYYASFGVAQGMGHDFGAGFFEDTEGDDYYWGGTLVQGATTKGSIGFFMDRAGDNSYICEDRGRGYADAADSIAIMMAPESSGNLKNEMKDNMAVLLGTSSAED